ncbi:hypothetical protein C6380_17595 [Pseudomonas syringae pv. actinidiae]|nr:hypothetical protein BUE60_11390 [Pseudomonas syringae pv. actinidiae]PBK55528.1 hypothetical protein BUE61_07290 [Pseudomonas syringae pv. actinidiae]RJX53982.1 hypothetical protein C6380_17595 [Pseudomonas syringae pv. actinidiae]RJX63543.1 hypothetical protein C6379_00355 [Pseudomonas syringae pv. actinidiae]RJY23994.1 hypothetical protein C6381_01030 [Pseudomonas syringae pv. actinidiae]
MRQGIDTSFLETNLTALARSEHVDQKKQPNSSHAAVFRWDTVARKFPLKNFGWVKVTFPSAAFSKAIRDFSILEKSFESIFVVHLYADRGICSPGQASPILDPVINRHFEVRVPQRIAQRFVTFQLFRDFLNDPVQQLSIATELFEKVD